MKKVIVIFSFFILVALRGVAQTDESDTTNTMPYTIDLSTSQFRLNSYSKSPMYFYTVYGQGNPFDFPFPSHFSIIDKTGLVGNIKEYVETIIKMCKAGLKVLNSLKEEEVEINGYKAYEISFNGKISETYFKTYMVILSNGKTTLLFTGRAVSDQKDMVKEFKAIARTIRIK
jgi:hypothetical protein